MICKQCGRTIRDNSVRCPFCGDWIREKAGSSSGSDERTQSRTESLPSLQTAPKRKQSALVPILLTVIALIAFAAAGACIWLYQLKKTDRAPADAGLSRQGTDRSSGPEGREASAASEQTDEAAAPTDQPADGSGEETNPGLVIWIPQTEQTEWLPAEQTERPYEETESPYEETERPYEETESPYEETERPYEETEPPYEETEPPYEETDPPETEPLWTEAPDLPPEPQDEIHYYEYFGSGADDWEEAEACCESLGGHLATLTTEEENNYVYQLLRQAGGTSAYFGLTDAATEGTWIWVTGEPVDYLNWHTGEPNNENRRENYGMFYYKYEDGSWNDGDFGNNTVGQEKGFLCEWETEDAFRAYLLSQQNPDPKNGIHYYKYFGSGADDWEEAETYCESLGGHLATLTTEEENNYVYQLMRQAGGTSAYFGLTDAETEGTWIWVTGEPADYLNWHTGEPNNENRNENYGMFYYKFEDGSWNDGDFGNNTGGRDKSFLCEWETEEAYLNCRLKKG